MEKKDKFTVNVITKLADSAIVNEVVAAIDTTRER